MSAQNFDFACKLGLQPTENFLITLFIARDFQLNFLYFCKKIFQQVKV